MKSFVLVTALLLGAPMVRAADAPTSQQLQTQLQEQTASIDALQRQVKETDVGDKAQYTYYQLALAYQKRALVYEKLKQWKDAAWDWYLADAMRFKIYDGKYKTLINGEAMIRTNQARDQLRAGDWDGANRSMKEARRGKGWESRHARQCLVGALVHLYFNRPDAALADALDAKARAPKESAILRDAYVALSLAYYQKGDLENTQTTWAEVLKLDPKFAVVKFFSPDGARRNAAIAQNPDDADAWLERGRYYLRFGDLFTKPKSKAIEAPGSSLPQPDSVQNFTASDAYFWNAAQRDFTRSVTLKRTPVALALRAQSLYKLENAPAIRKEGLHPPGLSWTEDERAAVATGADNFEAMDALRELYQYKADQIRADGGRARLRRAAQKQANSYASMALLHHPADPMAPVASFQLEEGADDLIEATRGATLDRPAATAREWKELGNEYRRRGDLYNALQSYEQALKLDPKYADAQSNVGSIYSDAGDYRRAIPAFRAAIALEAGHGVAHFNLASILRTMVFLPDALVEAEATVKYASPDLAAVALGARGNIRYLLQDRAGALADWRAEVALDPHQAQAWRAIGKVSLGDADFAGAREAFAKAVQLQPDDPFAKILLATVLNIAAFQEATQAQGKTIDATNSSAREIVHPEAAKLLAGVHLRSRAEWEELLHLWDELFVDTAMGRNEGLRPLADSGKIVLRTVYSERKLAVDEAD
ncbi:tetratricopeptide repeat protein [Horticoccus luteus]|uniref:Tetratricopeptide repeat protein n=1 Tax=Horticoccus luteus TaxID=2862869 RepID=A0A8F9TV64_9BACT|nr:tetratricopeptide repeat protein [Horticoccus luteus]QYM79665.1 tetratricopeptide repeat protein [Horticoccus luteus]